MMRVRVKNNWLSRWPLLLAALSLVCVPIVVMWFATSGERELKRQMHLIRTELNSIRSCDIEFHWSESGRITVVVLGIVEEPQQDQAIDWIKGRTAEGLFERFDRIEFFSADSWTATGIRSPRKLNRQAGL
jgi:hypothetical protein